MTSPNKPTSKPSRVAKMSVKPIWRKKLNPCNTSNELNVNSPTPMPKPLTPHHEPSQEKNHLNQALPNPYIKDTPTSPQVGRSMGAKQGAGFGIGGKIGKGLYKLGCDRERLKMIK
ncbi:hypothetical protein Tco_1473363, partial [Tanacetum coccineum]